MSDNVGKKATKAGIGYTIGNILIRGMAFITLPIFTRLMSTEDYGLYTTYVSYESIITLVLGLGLHASLKAAKVEFKERIDEYVSDMLIITVLFNILIFSIVFPFRNYIGAFFGFEGYIVLLMLFQALASAVLSMYNNRVGLDFQYKQYVVLSFANSLCNVTLSLLLMLTINKNNTFIGRVLGTSLSMILVAVVPVYIFLKKSRPMFKKKYLEFGLRYSLPLVPHGLSQLILAQFGKIIVQKQIGNYAAGIYGFTYSIAAIPQIIITSLDSAWGPWFFEMYAKGENSEIKKRTSQYVALFSIFIGGLFCISPEVIKVMADCSYWAAIQIICPAMLGVFFTFLYTLPAQIEYYYKKTKFIAIGTLVAALINVCLCLVCVPKYGYQSAVYVTVFTYIVYFIMHMLVASYITKNNLPFNVKAIMGYVIALCLLCICVQFLLNNWLVRYIIAFVWCVVIAGLNYDVIKSLLKSRK